MIIKFKTVCRDQIWEQLNKGYVYMGNGRVPSNTTTILSQRVILVAYLVMLPK